MGNSLLFYIKFREGYFFRVFGCDMLPHSKLNITAVRYTYNLFRWSRINRTHFSVYGFYVMLRDRARKCNRTAYKQNQKWVWLTCAKSIVQITLWWTFLGSMKMIFTQTNFLKATESIQIYNFPRQAINVLWTLTSKIIIFGSRFKNRLYIRKIM